MTWKDGACSGQLKSGLEGMILMSGCVSEWLSLSLEGQIQSQLLQSQALSKALTPELLLLLFSGV